MSQVAIIGGLVLVMCSSLCMSSMLMMLAGSEDGNNKNNNNNNNKNNNNNNNNNNNDNKKTGPKGLSGVSIIRLERPSANYPDNIINLGELEVYDMDGTNIARSQKVYSLMGNSHNAGPFERLVDGGATMGNFAHTGPHNGVSNIEVDLGSPQTIKEIVITNRRDCCQDRTQNMVVKFLDSNGDVIYESPPVEPSKDKMTFNLDTREWTY